MNVIERMRLCKMLVAMEDNPEYVKSLKLQNLSTFKGKSYSDYKCKVATNGKEKKE